jgi:hypothetical protein
MGCGCRKNKTTDTRSNEVMAGGYEVWRNGTYTGRSFASLGQAQTYANRVGGEVRTA